MKKLIMMIVVSAIGFVSTANAVNLNPYGNKYCNTMTNQEVFGNIGNDGSFNISSINLSGKLDDNGDIVSASYNGTAWTPAYIKDNQGSTIETLCMFAWTAKVKPLQVAQCPGLHMVTMINDPLTAGTFVVSKNRGGRVIGSGYINKYNQFQFKSFTIEGGGRRIVTDILKTQDMIRLYCEATAGTVR